MTLMQVNPARCRIWELNARAGEDLGPQSCGNLRNSIRAHGQKQPALGRRISTSDGCEIELIYGARRHFVAQELGIDLLVECRDIDDRSALIEMDIENRVRQDISPYDRGLAYKRWLSGGYFPNQIALSKALGISTAQICRLLRYAELPAVVVAAFASPREIREEWAGMLAKQCQDGTTRQQILTRARAAQSLPEAPSAQAVYEALLYGAGRARKKVSRDNVIKNAQGTPLFRVAYRSRTVHLVIARERLDIKMLDVITEYVTRALEASSSERPAPEATSHVTRENPRRLDRTASAVAVLG